MYRGGGRKGEGEARAISQLIRGMVRKRSLSYTKFRICEEMDHGTVGLKRSHYSSKIGKGSLTLGRQTVFSSLAEGDLVAICCI